MMEYVILIMVGILSGICAALGIGGGFVLLIYLTAVLSTNQLEAQLMNLVFFIPIAIISLIIHIRHKLVVKKIAFKAIITGSIGAVLGVFVATVLDAKLLSKLFAFFILIIGIHQLFEKERKIDDEIKEISFRMLQ